MPRGVYKRKEGVYPKVPKSETHKKKLSDKQVGILRGEKAWNWSGGISRDKYSIDWTISLRRTIRERDHYICRLCSKQQGDIAFDIHHIDYDKKNCNPSNLITLCRKCHVGTNGNRDYWKNYFKNIMNKFENLEEPQR